MKVIHTLGELSSVEGSLHAAIGVFDGVHKGHQAVIATASASARAAGGTSCVITFDPHPAKILAPAFAPRLLTSTAHKLRLLAELEIEVVAVIPFDRQFSETPAEEFINELSAHSDGLERICVGADWRFGKGGAGDVALLQFLGERRGFQVDGLPTVLVEGMVASSTRIREAVAGGDFSVAEKLLGRPYTVLGTVIEGKRLGRKLGFPTANLTVHSEQLPPTGVYAVMVDLDGSERPGVANLGYRPSVEGQAAKRLLEVHLLDWQGDLYGADMEVRFVRFLRGEQRFDGMEELKAQIERDAESARRLLGEEKKSAR